jgi:prevent-host-death family protein
MRTMTATEASRSFAAVLDDVEDGDTIVVTRGGKRIAEIVPASRGNGAAVLELLRTHHVDPDFGEDVAAARQLLDETEPAWPEK